MDVVFVKEKLLEVSNVPAFRDYSSMRMECPQTGPVATSCKVIVIWIWMSLCNKMSISFMFLFWYWFYLYSQDGFTKVSAIGCYSSGFILQFGQTETQTVCV